MARVGTAAHKLLQEAAEANLKINGGNSIESRWNELVQEIEQAMSNNWLERHLAPLTVSASRYEVAKQRALATAAEIANSTKRLTQQQTTTIPTAAVGVEQWFQTPDGTVAGTIDRILSTDAGSVIQDYKTGEIHDEIDGKVQLKLEYCTQLMLYAALWFLKTGEWPVRLELVALTGEPVMIPFKPSECLALIEEARATLIELNTYINAEFDSPNIERAWRLASPEPEVCSMCQYRPLCPAYLKAEKSSEAASHWPKDIIGVLHSIDVLQNSKLRLAVRSIDNGAQVNVVRGISNSKQRHPALSLLHSGARVGIYNLIRPGKDETYSESLLTTIYFYGNDLIEHLF